MLKTIVLENFGPLKQLSCNNLHNINLIIGTNGSGKTFLLKALYVAMRTIETYRRGDEPRSANQILFEKLYWTFQAEKLGDIVTKTAKDMLSCHINFAGDDFSYHFGKSTESEIRKLTNHTKPRLSNSIFLPPKEVMSLHQVILHSREGAKQFGFDDTYFDLVKALLQTTHQKENPTFSAARHALEKMLGGKIEYESATNRWQFKKGNQKFLLGITAEGIKKVSILETLLSNHFLDNHSIVFIDEPESALHPQAISQLLDIIVLLAECGIQFFLASHSYFVVKKLFLVAQEKQQSIPVVSLESSGGEVFNLLQGMPENSIINESIRLYEQEVELAFK